MNENTPPLAEPIPYDRETGEVLGPDSMGAVPAVGGGHQTALGNQAIKVLVSTPIVERRNLAVVRARLKALCAENGDRYVYSWTVKDRRNKRETVIEGLTIKAAMDLWRIYGNCFAGPLDCEDRGTHWLFTAIFFDRETGSIAMRSFLQRKSQQTGMRDQDRAEDIIFQIGQSKAIRNVIVNALSADANFMLEMSKKRLTEWISANRGKADEFIDHTCEEYAIDQRRIEAVIGRVRDQWTVRDMARVMAELRGIDEGLQNEQNAFPSIEAAGELMAEKQEAKKTDTEPDTKKGKKAATQQDPSTSADTKAPTEELKPATSKSRGRPKMTAEEKAKAKAEREAKKKGKTETPAEAAEGDENGDAAPEGPETPKEEESSPAPSEEPAEASQDEEAPQGELGGDAWDEFD